MSKRKSQNKNEKEGVQSEQQSHNVREIKSPEELTFLAQYLYDNIAKFDDLHCAIFGGSFIEHCVSTNLDKVLVQGDSCKTQLLKLDTISQAKILYCLGIIEKPLYTEIQNLAEVRNLFAHRLSTEFSDDNVVTECEKLNAKGVLALCMDRGSDGELKPISAKRRYVLSVVNAVNDLLVKALPLDQAESIYWANLLHPSVQALRA